MGLKVIGGRMVDMGVLPLPVMNFDPRQLRDEHGRWTDEGGGSSGKKGVDTDGTKPPVKVWGNVLFIDSAGKKVPPTKDRQVSLERVTVAHKGMEDQFAEDTFAKEEPVTLQVCDVIPSASDASGRSRRHMGMYLRRETPKKKSALFIAGALGEEEEHPRIAKDIPGGAFNVGKDLATVYRHEYAHHLYHSNNMWRAAPRWEKLMRDEGYFHQAQIDNPDAYRGSDRIRREVSVYVGTNHFEAFAETFAAYTHPGYKAGSLPPKIEAFYRENFPKRVKRK